MVAGSVAIDDRRRSSDDTLAADVRAGLTRRPRSLPPKYFYDARGSALFDRICGLPEYYPTRAERAILVRRARDLADMTGAAGLVELGSGTASKTRVLLSALAEAGTLRRYVPLDIDGDLLERTALELTDEYPGLSVHGIVGDFERSLSALPKRCGPRLIAFLGGTIGNLRPGPRRAFLRRLAAALRAEDTLLLGTDLVKDPDVLRAAYDDSAGVTAAFNRNVLAVLNRELGADFDPDAFAHVALWNETEQWIEMRLRSRLDQTVVIEELDLEVRFAAGEELLTEISAKFTVERIDADLASAGLESLARWTDDGDRFALTLAARLTGAPRQVHC